MQILTTAEAKSKRINGFLNYQREKKMDHRGEKKKQEIIINVNCVLGIEKDEKFFFLEFDLPVQHILTIEIVAFER